MNAIKLLNSVAVTALGLERRVDGLYRGPVDRVFREPLFSLAQIVLNAQREHDESLGIAEEREQPDEVADTQKVIDTMAAFLHRTWAPGHAERAGNTKTYGVVRGEFRVFDDIPERLRRGLFAHPRSFLAWVRFAGPGPLAPADVDDNGILSFAIKVMGVAGPKLGDELYTQDFLGISSPTFTTPNVHANVRLQEHVLDGTPLFYFLDPRDSHLLDLVMQGLYARTQTSPLEVPYWSCVPYLLGEGQAMQYSLRPRSKRTTRVPLFPSDNYLRETMAETLDSREVVFDLYVQLQTDADRMPVENASVRWSERLSEPVPVAELRLPIQRFDSPEQLAFAGNLSFNPWHALPEHRPLGNQNRARKAIYETLARVRQEMNAQPHIEPTGDERFPGSEPIDRVWSPERPRSQNGTPSPPLAERRR
ncbi:catalase family protein [Solirubrobacter soli]|uniref:catalase family protein n=1 Tax=Solirubrobacter soli TaxID=363832 RepID=UPI0003FE3FA2|nr:catalase family protein [Solirubrobacter soli]